MVAPDLSRAQWRVSSRTGGNGACVEVAAVDRQIIVRDTKDRTGPVLAFDEHAWEALVKAVKAGEHDL